jgi:hypothetical protein
VKKFGVPSQSGPCDAKTGFTSPIRHDNQNTKILDDFQNASKILKRTSRTTIIRSLIANIDLVSRVYNVVVAISCFGRWKGVGRQQVSEPLLFMNE